MYCSNKNGHSGNLSSDQTGSSFYASMRTIIQEYANLEQTINTQNHEIMSLRATIDALTKQNHALSEECQGLKDNGRKYRLTKNRLGQRCSQVSRLQKDNQQMKKILASVRQTVGQ